MSRKNLKTESDCNARSEKKKETDLRLRYVNNERNVCVIKHAFVGLPHENLSEKSFPSCYSYL